MVNRILPVDDGVRALWPVACVAVQGPHAVLEHAQGCSWA